MNKKNGYKIAAVIIICVLLGLITTVVKGDSGSGSPYGEPVKIRTTCYTESGQPCANGHDPVMGLTVAGREEWLGYACLLYEVNPDGSMGDLIGIFQFCDTGYGIDIPESDKGTIQVGQSIDVYRSTDEDIRDWIDTYGDYTYLQVVPAKG